MLSFYAQQRHSVIELSNYTYIYSVPCSVDRRTRQLQDSVSCKQLEETGVCVWQAELSLQMWSEKTEDLLS